VKTLTCGLLPWSTRVHGDWYAVTEFGGEVARLLSERGMSLRQAARLTHYDPSYLSKVISGTKPGSRQLADALDRSGGLLLEGARIPRDLVDAAVAELPVA